MINETYNIYSIHDKSKPTRVIPRACFMNDKKLNSIGCIPLKQGLEDILWDDCTDTPIPYISSPELYKILWDKKEMPIDFLLSSSVSC